MITWEQALRLITETPVRFLGSENVALEFAHGRVIARDIVAGHDQPSEARSTMDGVAVADSNLGAGTTLELLAPRHAGGDGFGHGSRIATARPVHVHVDDLHHVSHDSTLPDYLHRQDTHNLKSAVCELYFLCLTTITN